MAETLPIWGWVCIPIFLALCGALAQHFYHDHKVEVDLTAIAQNLTGRVHELDALERRVLRLEDLRMGYNRIREDDDGRPSRD